MKKTCFITGARGGLGMALIKTFLAYGYNVAAASRNWKTLPEFTEDIKENFLPLEVNLLDEKSIRDAVDKTAKQFSKIDVVVNNAGYVQCGSIEELTIEEMKACFDVNLFGAIRVVQAVLPHMRIGGEGI